MIFFLEIVALLKLMQYVLLLRPCVSTVVLWGGEKDFLFMSADAQVTSRESGRGFIAPPQRPPIDSSVLLAVSTEGPELDAELGCTDYKEDGSSFTTESGVCKCSCDQDQVRNPQR